MTLTVAIAEQRMCETSIISKVTSTKTELMKGNGLVGDKIYFETDAGPDCEPVEFPVKVFTAGELIST